MSKAEKERRARERKAEEMWGSIEDSGIDLKRLAKDVKKTKDSKKQLKNTYAKGKKTRSGNTSKRVEKVVAVHEQIREASTALALIVNQPETLALGHATEALHNVEAALPEIRKLPPSRSRTKLLNQARDLKRIARDAEVIDVQAKVIRETPPALRLPPPGKARRKLDADMVAAMRKRALDIARRMRSKSRDLGSRAATRLRSLGVAGRAAASSAASKAASAPQSTAEGAAAVSSMVSRAVKSSVEGLVVAPMRNIRRAIGVVGLRMQDAYQRSMEMLEGGKMALGRLVNFAMRPIRAGTSSIGGMIGMATLIPSMILPFIKGVDEALTERFGEKYIQRYIGGLWDKSWGFLMKQVKDFLGIDTKDPKERAAEHQASSTDMLRRMEGAYKADPSLENKHRLDNARMNKAGANLYHALANNQGSDAVVLQHLNLYQSATRQKKLHAKNALEGRIKFEIADGSLSRSTAERVRAAGIEVPEAKIRIGEAPKVQSTIQSKYTTTAPAFTTKYGGGGSVSKPAGAASAPPMETSKGGGVAAPATPSNSTPTSETPGRASSSSTPGVALVPNFMGDQAFFAVNSRTLG